jgi:hypothetical protein
MGSSRLSSSVITSSLHIAADAKHLYSPSPYTSTQTGFIIIIIIIIIRLRKNEVVEVRDR